MNFIRKRLMVRDGHNFMWRGEVYDQNKDWLVLHDDKLDQIVNIRLENVLTMIELK